MSQRSGHALVRLSAVIAAPAVLAVVAQLVGGGCRRDSEAPEPDQNTVHENDGGPAESFRPSFPVELPRGAEYRRDLSWATTSVCNRSWYVFTVPMTFDDAVAFYEERLGRLAERTGDRVTFDLGDRGRLAFEKPEDRRTLTIGKRPFWVMPGPGGRVYVRYDWVEHCEPRSEEDASVPRKYPSHAEVNSALESVRPEAQACAGGRSGSVKAEVEFEGSSGSVLSVRVTGDFTGPAAECMEDAIRKARVPPFESESLGVTYPFRF